MQADRYAPMPGPGNTPIAVNELNRAAGNSAATRGSGSPRDSGGEPPGRCRNCDTPLEGEYCSACGQREGRGDVRLSDVAGDVVDDVLHWDSRLWRTLVALVTRPGLLTAEFIDGRKARYVPIFRLYIVISFLLFLVFSLDSSRVSVETHVQPAPAGEEGAAAEGEEDTRVSFDFRFQRRGEEAVGPDGETAEAPFSIAQADGGCAGTGPGVRR